MKNRLSLAHYPLQSLPMATWVQSNAHWCKSVLIIVIFSGAFSAQAAPAKHAAHSSAVGHHAPVTRPLPMFEFRNVNTRDTYSEPCKDKTFSTVTNDGSSSCIDIDTIVGHVATTTSNYYRFKLYSVISEFKDYGYSDIKEAFIYKYGPPQHSQTRKWQSKGGATFDNLVESWEFQGGLLELESMGSEVGMGRFTFVSSENAPPKSAPKLDF